MAIDLGGLPPEAEGDLWRLAGTAVDTVSTLLGRRKDYQQYIEDADAARLFTEAKTRYQNYAQQYNENVLPSIDEPNNIIPSWREQRDVAVKEISTLLQDNPAAQQKFADWELVFDNSQHGYLSEKVTERTVAMAEATLGESIMQDVSRGNEDGVRKTIELGIRSGVYGQGDLGGLTTSLKQARYNNVKIYMQRTEDPESVLKWLSDPQAFGEQWNLDPGQVDQLAKDMKEWSDQKKAVQSREAEQAQAEAFNDWTTMAMKFAGETDPAKRPLLNPVELAKYEYDVGTANRAFVAKYNEAMIAAQKAHADLTLDQTADELAAKIWTLDPTQKADSPASAYPTEAMIFDLARQQKITRDQRDDLREQLTDRRKSTDNVVKLDYTAQLYKAYNDRTGVERTVDDDAIIAAAKDDPETRSFLLNLRSSLMDKEKAREKAQRDESLERIQSTPEGHFEAFKILMNQNIKPDDKIKQIGELVTNPDEELGVRLFAKDALYYQGQADAFYGSFDLRDYVARVTEFHRPQPGMSDEARRKLMQEYPTAVQSLINAWLAGGDTADQKNKALKDAYDTLYAKTVMEPLGKNISEGAGVKPEDLIFDNTGTKLPAVISDIFSSWGIPTTRDYQEALAVAYSANNNLTGVIPADTKFDKYEPMIKRMEAEALKRAKVPTTKLNTFPASRKRTFYSTDPIVTGPDGKPQFTANTWVVNTVGEKRDDGKYHLWMQVLKYDPTAGSNGGFR